MMREKEWIRQSWELWIETEVAQSISRHFESKSWARREWDQWMNAQKKELAIHNQKCFESYIYGLHRTPFYIESKP